MALFDEATLRFIDDHRIAHLATVDASGQPMVVPVCFVREGEAIYSVVDLKPKGVAARRLKRLRNIQENPRVAIVVDDYSEDWGRLSYAMVSGEAVIMEPSDDRDEHERAVIALRRKYPQYRSMRLEDRPIIRITPNRLKMWRSQEER